MDKKISYDSLSSLYANFGELYQSYRNAFDSIQDIGSDRITGNDERTEQINASNQATVESLRDVVREYQVQVDHARRRLSKMRAEYEYYKNERDRALREARENGTSLKDLFKNTFGLAEINRFKRMDAEINFLEGFLSDYDKLTEMVNSPNALDSMFNLEMDELVEKMSSDVSEVIANTVVSRVKVEDLGDKKRITISYDGFEFKPIDIPNDEFTMEKVEQIRNAVVCKATLDKEQEMKVVLDVNGKEIETTLNKMGYNIVEELAHSVTQEEVQEQVETVEETQEQVETVEETQEQVETVEETQEQVETPEVEELTAEQKYANDGFGQNAFGEYFNPNIDEFDPDYNPNMDPMYATQVVTPNDTPSGNDGSGQNDDNSESLDEQDKNEELGNNGTPSGNDGSSNSGSDSRDTDENEKDNDQKLYSDKTYEVIAFRERYKENTNKFTKIASVAAVGLFGLSATGLATVPAAAILAGAVVGAQTLHAASELKHAIRRACVKHKLKRLAKKAGCVFRTDDGKAWFEDLETGKRITSQDLDELQAANDEDLNIQEKLDKIFHNDRRGVTNASTSYEYDYRGFQKVTVDNLEAAFEEFGGVKKEDEMSFKDKFFFGKGAVEAEPEDMVSTETVSEEEEREMIDAQVPTAEEIAAEMENAETASMEEVQETVENEQETTMEDVEEVEEEKENGTSLEEDEAIEAMIEQSGFAEMVAESSKAVEPEALSNEEIQALLAAVDGQELEQTEEEAVRKGM